MIRDLLVMAWPFGDTVLTSFRWAEDYFPPDLFLGTAKLSQISSWVNETMYEVIFRCEGCLSWTADDGSIETVATTDGRLLLGHAQSHDAPDNPGCPDDILVKFHDNGFGLWMADIGNASSTDYTKWAALATKTVPDTCTTATSS
jgi:cellobiose dehydrogenase (acceptor)